MSHCIFRECGAPPVQNMEQTIMYNQKTVTVFLFITMQSWVIVQTEVQQKEKNFCNNNLRVGPQNQEVFQSHTSLCQKSFMELLFCFCFFPVNLYLTRQVFKNSYLQWPPDKRQSLSKEMREGLIQDYYVTMLKCKSPTLGHSLSPSSPSVLKSS